MGQAEHLKATELYDLDRLTIQRQIVCHGKLYELVGGNELKLVWPIDAGVLSKDSKVKQNEGYVTE